MKANAVVAVAYACAGVICAVGVYVLLDLWQTRSPSSCGERPVTFQSFLSPYHRR